MNYENELTYLEDRIKSIQYNHNTIAAFKDLTDISSHNDVGIFLSKHKNFNFLDIDPNNELKTIKGKLAYSFVEYMIQRCS